METRADDNTIDEMQLEIGIKLQIASYQLFEELEKHLDDIGCKEVFDKCKELNRVLSAYFKAVCSE